MMRDTLAGKGVFLLSCSRLNNRLIKIFGIGLAIMIFIILAVTVYFYINKDSITKNLLLGINSHTNGELQIDKVEINPFIHFPHISLTLNESRYFEEKVSAGDTINNQIFHFSRIHFSFDVLKLLNSRIEITGISAEDGSVNIIQNMDSTFNISNVLQTAEKDEKGIMANPQSLGSANDSTLISLSITQFRLSGVDVVIDLTPSGQKQTFKVNQSNASFNYVADSIQCELSSDFTIYRIGLSETLSLEKEDIAIDVDLFYDRNDSIINIYQSDIAFRSAQLYADGQVDLKEGGDINVSFEAMDQELQFTKLFLTSEGIDNIMDGGLFLKGKIRGSMNDQIPEVEYSFGADKVQIQLPNSSESLYNLMIDGHFSSGTRADLSGATIEIDTITTLPPGGHLHGSGRITNVKTPEINYILDASLSLESLNSVFELGPFDGLNGSIDIKDEYHGIIQEDGVIMDLSNEPFSLKLDSVSFELVNIMHVELLNGSVSGNPDSLILDNLYVETQNSDFLLHGILHNFSDFIYKEGKRPIVADLSVRSNQYDFPEFFSFLPKTAESFPYQIHDISLEVRCETNYEKLTQFNTIPELNFKIYKASGAIESFLPFARLHGGTFIMYEIDSTAIFDFTDFNIEMAASTAEANYTLYDVPEGLDSMVIHLKTGGINPAKIIYNSNDSLPAMIDAEIKGDFISHIVLPDDSLLLFHAVSLVASDVKYLGQDTISAQQMQLYSRDISLDNTSETNPLSTLTATNHLHFNALVTSIFQFESLDLHVGIDNGEFTLIPHDHQQFGRNEHGTIILSPFEEPPRYQLEYGIEELPLEEFLESFYSEKLFTGDVDLYLDLQTNGDNVKDITSNMSGRIKLKGDSLVLTGLNLDELINNFRRSQSFNLVDVGAVALAGPAGILYTKGSDYAMLLTTKKGDSTAISRISSNWNLDNGNISIEDVAFATLENRVAAKGWLNMKTNSLDVTIAVIEETGCAMIDQRIYGRSAAPEYGKVKIIKTLFSPVTKLLNNVVGKDCNKFYEGIVSHPQLNTPK